MGYDPETAVFEGRHLWKEIPEAVGTTFYNKYHQALKEQTPITFEEYYEPLDAWLSVRTFPSDHGLSIYFRDITDQKHREQTLEHREQVLREIHTLTADRDTSFTEKIQALLALGRDELGTDYGSLSHIDDDEYIFEVVDTDKDDISAGDVVPVEATNCERVATETETLVAGDVERDAPEETDRTGYTEWGISCYLGAPVIVNGEVYGTFCFYDTEPRERQFDDWEVTIVDLLAHWASYELQREQTTQQLTEQNRRLDRFASIVSHDLRNPLNVALGRASLLKQVSDDEFQEHILPLENSLERMEAIIKDTLTLAQQGETISEQEPVDISTLVDECWKNVATEHATIDVVDAFDVQADKSRLKHILENLFRNAIEHGSEEVVIQVGRDGDDIFYIEDNGPGVPETDREQIFEVGHSSNPEGTGFGLTIVQRIAEAHGWGIQIEEGKDGGARFVFTGVEIVDN